MHHLRNNKVVTAQFHSCIRPNREYIQMHFEEEAAKKRDELRKNEERVPNDISNTMYAMAWNYTCVTIIDFFFFAFICVLATKHYLWTLFFTYAILCWCVCFCASVSFFFFSLETTAYLLKWKRNDLSERQSEKPKRNMPECKWFLLKNTFCLLHSFLVATMLVSCFSFRYSLRFIFSDSWNFFHINAYAHTSPNEILMELLTFKQIILDIWIAAKPL